MRRLSEKRGHSEKPGDSQNSGGSPKNRERAFAYLEQRRLALAPYFAEVSVNLGRRPDATAVTFHATVFTFQSQYDGKAETA
jgi:hypothetical protein